MEYEQEMGNELWEVRAGLVTTSNADYTAATTYGGVEVNKNVDKMIADSFNRSVELLPLITDETIFQQAKIWSIRTDLGSTNKTAVYSEGGTGTPYPSTKEPLIQNAISVRSDYEVSGLMQAVSSGYMDSLADELRDAIDSHAIGLEKMIICGDVTSAHGLTSGFPGLLQLMGSYQYNSDVTAVHGVTRASTITYVDVQSVDASAGALTLAMLNSAITKVNKVGAKPQRKVFLCSYERADEISELLQAQQRFSGTLNLEGGFSVSTYKTIPIVPSIYMDKNGIDSTAGLYTATDKAMYLLNLDECALFNVAGVKAVHVPLAHSSDSGVRYDVAGGYLKSYVGFRLKSFVRHCVIADLATP